MNEEDDVIVGLNLKNISMHNLVMSTCMLMMKLELEPCKLQRKPANLEECIMNLRVDHNAI